MQAKILHAGCRITPGCWIPQPVVRCLNGRATPADSKGRVCGHNVPTRKSCSAANVNLITKC